MVDGSKTRPIFGRIRPLVRRRQAQHIALLLDPLKHGFAAWQDDLPEKRRFEAENAGLDRDDLTL